ncbi:MAG: DUF349 domain-containing protein [Cyclobacteriaceae bacterium]
MSDEKKFATEKDSASYPVESVQDKPELSTPAEEPSESKDGQPEDNQKKSVAEMARAFLEDADYEKKLKNAEVENAEVENAEVENAEVENAEVENAEVENAEVEKAEVEKAEVEKAEVEKAAALVSHDATEEDTEATEDQETGDDGDTKGKNEHEEGLDLIEHADISSMNKEDLLHTITKVANKYSTDIHSKTLGAIKDTFDGIFNKEREEALARFVETGGLKEDFVFKGDETSSKFNEYYNLIRNNRHQHFKEKEKEKEKNLSLKNELLEKLRETVDSEESTASMTSLKEIQAEWRSIGPVPPQQNKTLWANYHALIDRFYDHRSIYFELKELDRKKNYEAKLEICQKAEELDELENFKDAIQKLNELHDEFKHVGPIPKDVQDEVWDRFKTASDLIYSKRKEFVSHVKEQQKENLAKKLQLSETIEAFTQFDSEKINEWNGKTKELLAIQKEWEAIGAMPRETAKEVNKKFWGSFKAFFHNKSEFFKKLESQREDNLKLKEDLVAQARALEDSTDWHKTAEVLKGLQQKWKDIGPVPEKHRNHIYKSFKSACDSFFNKRRQHNQGLDSEYVENLKKKEEICDLLEKMASTKDVDMEEVYNLQDTYNEIGFVPRKNIKSIQRRYQDALNKLVKNAENLDASSKSEFKSLINIHELKSGPNADQKLNRKEYSLRRKITTLESDISTWKNNIGFFASSKNADELLKDFQEKIENAERELKELKEELKLIMTV